MSDVSRQTKKVLINPNFCASKVHFNPHFVNTTASKTNSLCENAKSYPQVYNNCKNQSNISNISRSSNNGSSAKTSVYPEYSSVQTKTCSTATLCPSASQKSRYTAPPSMYTLVKTNYSIVQGSSLSRASTCSIPAYSSVTSMNTAASRDNVGILSSKSYHSSSSSSKTKQPEARSTQDSSSLGSHSHNNIVSSQHISNACSIKSIAGQTKNSVCSVQPYYSQYYASQNVQPSSESISQHLAHISSTVYDKASKFKTSTTRENSSVPEKIDSHSYYVNPNFFQNQLSIRHQVPKSMNFQTDSKPKMNTTVPCATSNATAASYSESNILPVGKGYSQHLHDTEDVHSTSEKQTTKYFEPLLNKDQSKVRKVLVNPKFYNEQKLKNDSVLQNSHLAVSCTGAANNCLKNRSPISIEASTSPLPINSIETLTAPQNSSRASEFNKLIAFPSSNKNTFTVRDLKNLSNKIVCGEHSLQILSSKNPNNSLEKTSVLDPKFASSALNLDCKVNALKNGKTDFYQVSKTKLVRKNSHSNLSTKSPKSTLYHLSSKKLIRHNSATVKPKILSSTKIVSTFKIKNKLIVKTPDIKHSHLINSLKNHKRTSPPARKYSTLTSRKLVRRLSTDSNTASKLQQSSVQAQYKVWPRQKNSLPKNAANNGIKSDRFVKIGSSMYKTTPTSLKRHTATKKNKSISVSGGQSVQTIRSPLLRSKSYILKNGYSNYGHRLHSSTLPVNKKFGHNFHHTSVGKSIHFQKHVFHQKAYYGQSPRQAMYMGRKYINANSQQKYSMHFKPRPGHCLSINLRTNAAKTQSSYGKDHQQILAAHALKAQALQRLIVAAKRRSMLKLKRRTSAAEPSSKATSGGSVSEDTNSADVASSMEKTTATKPQKLVTYCRFYHRFGKCFRGDACPYEHNPDRVAICTRFLRGRCRVEKCLFAHTLDKGRMPVCSHFLKGGLCVKDDCPYLHVNPNRNAPICEDFLHGHCDKREQCKLQHVLECAEYRETGRCPRLQCPLPHPRHRRAAKKLSTSENKKKKRPRSSLSNSEGNRSVLGAVSTRPPKAKVKKLQENVRYFEGGSTSSDVGSFNDPAQPEQLEEKRRRIAKLVESMKTRTKEANITTTTTRKMAAAARTGSTTTGKYKLASESEVIFVQPLCNFSVDDAPLPFIPLSSEPGSASEVSSSLVKLVPSS